MELVAYLPVLHRGYLEMFQQAGCDRLYIIGPDFTFDYKPILKDIRALEADLMAEIVRSLSLFESVSVLDLATSQRLNASGTSLLMPDEDISRSVAASFFPDCDIEFRSIFLRWDRQRITAQLPAVPDSTIAEEDLSAALDLANHESNLSSDWWRQVGAVVIRDGSILLSAHNTHLPTEQNPYVLGDPRANMSQGARIDLSTAIHAEAKVIAEAAASGLALRGADMLVTTFPCPPCAKLVAVSGIKRCYYRDGYAMLDGESILRSYGVEIIRIGT